MGWVQHLFLPCVPVHQRRKYGADSARLECPRESDLSRRKLSPSPQQGVWGLLYPIQPVNLKLQLHESFKTHSSFSSLLFFRDAKGISIPLLHGVHHKVQVCPIHQVPRRFLIALLHRRNDEQGRPHLFCMNRKVLAHLHDTDDESFKKREKSLQPVRPIFVLRETASANSEDNSQQRALILKLVADQ